jgi:hypothetical protein
MPDPDLDCLPILDPGVKKAPDSGSSGQKGSGSATLPLTFRHAHSSVHCTRMQAVNTVYNTCIKETVLKD